MYILNSSFSTIIKSFDKIYFNISALHQQLFLGWVKLNNKSIWDEDTSCMELQAMHFTILCVVFGMDVLHFVQTIT